MVGGRFLCAAGSALQRQVSPLLKIHLGFPVLSGV